MWRYVDQQIANEIAGAVYTGQPDRDPNGDQQRAFADDEPEDALVRRAGAQFAPPVRRGARQRCEQITPYTPMCNQQQRTERQTGDVIALMRSRLPGLR